MKLITNIIKKIKFDRKILKRDQIWSKKFKKLILVDFNWKEIEIRSKSLQTICFCRWILIQTDIDNQIWTALLGTYVQFYSLPLILTYTIYSFSGNQIPFLWTFPKHFNSPTSKLGCCCVYSFTVFMCWTKLSCLKRSMVHCFSSHQSKKDWSVYIFSLSCANHVMSLPLASCKNAAVPSFIFSQPIKHFESRGRLAQW